MHTEIEIKRRDGKRGETLGKKRQICKNKWHLRNTDTGRESDEVNNERRAKER